MDEDALGCQAVRARELPHPHPLTRHELALALRSVVPEAEQPDEALSLCPPHRWGCPVIMKLDPEHVAWTCGWCGLPRRATTLG